LSLTDWQVAIARLDSEIEGPPKRGLVLAPLHGGLLCATFLTSDIPELPQAPLEQPQELKELKADCTHAADISFENLEYLRGDPCDNQANAFAPGPLAQPTLPQQFSSQQPPVCPHEPIPQLPARIQGPIPQPPAHVQGPLAQSQACVQEPLPQSPVYVQGPLSQLQAQHGELHVTLDAQHVLIGELVSGNGEPATTIETNPNVDFQLIESSWDVRSLYDGDMDAVAMTMVPGQTVGVTQDPQEIMQFVHF